ncbi:MAG TPA: signal peptidase I [Verrucomicrobiae bacterium]
MTQAFRLRVRQYWQREIRPLLILAVVLFSIRSSFADWNDVPTGSMKPTILEGDRVFINKLAYDLKVPFTTWHLAEWANPQRGDIVVFYSPQDGTRLVKRVIGLPGDTIELRDEQLVINGQPMNYASLNTDISGQLSGTEQQDSRFATERLTGHTHAVMAIPRLPAKRTFGPVQVPEGKYFMMGDNRDNSFDSRYFGTVDRKQIIGKATSVVMSLDKKDYYLPRTQRFFKPLDAKDSD